MPLSQQIAPRGRLAQCANRQWSFVGVLTVGNLYQHLTFEHDCFIPTHAFYENIEIEASRRADAQ
jgi:hypothetical protein